MTAAAIAPEPCSAPPENNAPDGVAERGDNAANNEDQQAAYDQRLAADTVGKQAERDLKQGLGQSINTNRQTDKRLAGAL
ncbi:Uncharacterised protein [Raoultella terrigena]|uniref:Uncharacterized protein n=1 Tax=Raoultella terrigena TaxID=577 RepID=A0A3P8JQS3_RAOTE|nr:Uncharacterised protein [Raoultella terrigena]